MVNDDNKDEIDTTEETEEAKERIEKSGRGLKILAPQQMITRLPISLAQLNAGNNSKKLKNEIRQILYSLYRSKELTKKVFEHLIEAI